MRFAVLLALVAAAAAFSPSPRLGGVSRCARGASNVQCIFQSEEERAARARESRAKALSGARLIGFTGGAVAGRQVWSELKAEGLVEDQPLKDALDGLDLPEIDTSALSGGDLSSLKPDLSTLKLPELPLLLAHFPLCFLHAGGGSLGLLAGSAGGTYRGRSGRVLFVVAQQQQQGKALGDQGLHCSGTARDADAVRRPKQHV